MPTSRISLDGDGLAGQVSAPRPKRVGFRETDRGGPVGLYLHIPFCFHKCHYCDFYSIVDHQDRQEAFADALIAELTDATERYDLHPVTIFVGGGTPTLLATPLWKKLLAALAGLGILDRIEEFTVEANPETVQGDLMAVLAAGGVNRISIGAQSFNTTLLKTLERWHDPASVARAVAMARDAGIDNINLDLIFAIPGQTDVQLHADLDALLALSPEHLSCYSLIFEPGTALTQKKQLGRIQPVDERIEAGMYTHVIQRLAAAGFEHYEISNWSRPDRRCRHNMVYWQGGDYLGVGPAASSYVAGERWKNKPHLGAYLAKSPHPPTMDHETLDEDRQIGEKLMLALRLRDGVPLNWLDKVLAHDANRLRTISEFEQLGLLERTTDHLRVTDRGLLVADALAAKLL